MNEHKKLPHKKTFSKKEIFQTLVALCENGKVLATCRLCNLPLTYEEVNEAKCSNCGDINQHNDINLKLLKIVDLN